MRQEICRILQSGAGGFPRIEKNEITVGKGQELSLNRKETDKENPHREHVSTGIEPWI